MLAPCKYEEKFFSVPPAPFSPLPQVTNCQGSPWDLPLYDPKSLKENIPVTEVFPWHGCSHLGWGRARTEETILYQDLSVRRDMPQTLGSLWLLIV